jgi:hypothetical protein
VKKLVKVAVVGVFTLFFSLPISSFADDVPMTINGQINCANAANAMTTTCGGHPQQDPSVPVTQTPPPAPVPVPTLNASPNAEAINCAAPGNSSLPKCQPMTINGQINCAQADNSLTTTCWDQAQAAKTNGTQLPAVDCSNVLYKSYPACTGVKPQAVIDYEKSQRDAAKNLPPAAVNCSNPMLSLTMACTNRTTTDLPADCSLASNKNTPRCQPMTINGQINCAQPDNAMTTTCWAKYQESVKTGKSDSKISGVNCSNALYKQYPSCTGVSPSKTISVANAQLKSAASPKAAPVQKVPPQKATTTPKATSKK